MGHAAAFYLFSTLMVGSSLAILLTASIVRAAVWLLGALGAAAGLFLLLSANFIAAIQLIVYAGGILVLIVFGVMLTSRNPSVHYEVKKRDVIVTGVVGLILFIGLLAVQFSGPWPAIAGAAADGPPTSVKEIGAELLTTWLVPFELVSVLLLAVMIGAAYLARPLRSAS